MSQDPASSSSTAAPTSDSEVAETTAPLPFGELLVQGGHITREQLERALQLQEIEARRGVFLRLGELVVSLGYATQETVGKILADQGRPILFCPTCLAQYNVLGEQGPDSYRCSRCDVPLEAPGQIADIDLAEEVEPGQLLESGEERQFGPYVVLEQISRGGMGLIYKARQRSLDRLVAMKVLSGVSSEEAEAFQAEARAVARLRHPYVVAIHDVGRVQGVHYFTMDYVDGQTLDRAIASEALPQRQIVQIFLKLCEAIDYVHSQGLLHRDVKPSNVMVDKKLNPVLIDFGIARDERAEESGTGEIVGSPAYLPPEYLSGDAGYTARGEVYSLGATLYTALAGRAPHSGIDTRHLLRERQREAPKHIRAVRRNVDRELATIVMTALARDPGDRYPSVRDLGNDLRRWLEGEEVAGRQTQLGRLWSRYRGRVAAALGLFVSLLLLTVSVTDTAGLARRGGEIEALRAQQVQLERELLELKLSLGSSHLSSADPVRMRQAADDLTHMLSQERYGAYQGRIFRLRAELRAALGDEQGAHRDRLSAERSGS